MYYIHINRFQIDEVHKIKIGLTRAIAQDSENST